MSSTIYYSVIKILACEIILGVMAFLPLAPGFSRGLVYTAFLFKPEFLILRMTTALFLSLLFIYLIPMLLRALRGVPMVELDREWISVNTMRSRRLKVSSITSINFQSFGNAVITVKSGQSVVIPLFLSQNGRDSMQKLTKIMN